jgi:AcrR family transcriptional regulator
MAGRRPRVKTAYHHGNLRNDLVTAAVEIIRKSGPDALTLRVVAQRLGVSQTAPYRHFASKEALLTAVAAEGFTSLLTSIHRALDAVGADPIVRLQTIGKSYIRFALAWPAHFAVMYGPRPTEFSVGAVAEAGRAAFSLLTELVVACQSAGTLRAGNPTRMGVQIWGIMHGLATLYLHGLLPRSLSEAELEALGEEIVAFLRPLPHI